VLKDDRSLAVFPVVSIASAAIALLAVVALGAAIAEAVGFDWVVLPFLAVGGYLATFLVVYFNVALAGAARKSIDGRDTTLADGLAVARQRRGMIAKWALLQFGIGVIISVLGSLLSDGSGDEPAGNVLTSVAGAAWSLASFFVIPLLALEGLGPSAALHRSVGLVREQWAEATVGRTGISLVVFLVAVLPVAGAFSAADELSATDAALGGVAWGVALLGLVIALAVGSALGVIFRVELYRYVTGGELTDNFARRDLDAVFGRKA